MSVGTNLSPEQLAEIEELIRSHGKITAIKRYREITGLGLKEAKDAVDAMAAKLDATLASPPEVATGEFSAIEEEIRKGNKIAAIKLYREKTGVGLKEALEAVDAMALPITRMQFEQDRQARQQAASSSAMAGVEAAIRAGKLIEAIKLHREATGMGLKESKDAVEAMRDRMR